MKFSIKSVTRDLNDNRRISCRLGARCSCYLRIFSGPMKGQTQICHMLMRNVRVTILPIFINSNCFSPSFVSCTYYEPARQLYESLCTLFRDSSVKEGKEIKCGRVEIEITNNINKCNSLFNIWKDIYN